MSFKFNWPSFGEEFVEQARQLLTDALNKSNKPANIVDHITVKELNMGTKPPELEILEVGDLSFERFRGIFKLTYSGDAHLVLQTKVQANPMNNNALDMDSFTRRGILAADQPLVVPMLLRLSNLKLRGIIVLVVSKQKGVTLVFKNDPLEGVDVMSTFDNISSIQRYLQTEIEKRLRTMFQEDLPLIVHKLSLKKWFGEEKKIPEQQPKDISDRSPSPYGADANSSDSSLSPDIRQSSLSSPNSESSSSFSLDTSFYGDDGYSSFVDVESLEDGSVATYSNFGELFDKHKEKGLIAITQQKDDHNDDNAANKTPRVFHRQVLVLKPSTWLPSPIDSSTRSSKKNQRPPVMTPSLSSMSSEESSRLFQRMTAANLQRHDRYQVSSSTTAPPPSLRQSITTLSSTSIVSPTTSAADMLLRTDSYPYTSLIDADYISRDEGKQEIVLQPSEISVAAQLATLMKSNHTISPYTRTLQHVTFRSAPRSERANIEGKKTCGRVAVKRRIIKIAGSAFGGGHLWGS
ncbi:662_t:CDS:2 [Paraglomus brasilianum]|uniref:Mitochondrial distribution and morphology protein 34 n=1 Tax=Paraglomus brasilianum TaxID=144538 RepID=A0A9N9AEF5_9GLOM|nr:662_t:CDS:2 [Paraglomus brasilianum]